jgi:hypothetical protein
VITIAMSRAIGADPEAVWRALTQPSQLARWDPRIVALLDPIPGYPRVGQRVRWRYRLGSVEVITHQTVRTAIEQQTLHSAISLGLFRFDETYTLVREGAGPQTRLTLKWVTSNSVPVVGGLVDRFAVRRMSASLVDARLAAVQKWCENAPEPAQMRHESHGRKRESAGVPR